MMVLSGTILILGATACDSNELPAATSAGFVLPAVTMTPSIVPASPTPTDTLPATEIPTNSPDPTLTLTAVIAPPPICQETTGRIDERQLESENLDDPLEYLVYLPPCYLEEPNRHYPTLYLFHGQTYTHRHWIDLGAVNIADRMISSGELAPFIMVFPFDQDHYDPPTQNPFGDAVLFDLIPAIDRTFRTIPTREARVIGGISRGGNWAAHLSLQHPEFFSAIGLHSTPIFSTDSNKEIREWLEAIPIETFPRLFLDIGKNTSWLEYTQIFEELLNEAIIPHEWHLYPGFHEDDYWEAHLEQYMRWYVHSWNVDGERK